jgi:hypothetical protein
LLDVFVGVDESGGADGIDESDGLAVEQPSSSRLSAEESTIISSLLIIVISSPKALFSELNPESQVS